MEIVEVEWLDSCEFSGWRDKDLTGLSLSHVHTVGYLVQETPDSITLVMNISDDHYGAIWVIPKGSIKSQKKIGDVSW